MFTQGVRNFWSYGLKLFFIYLCIIIIIIIIIIIRKLVKSLLQNLN